jgi:hypothetical protein
VAEHYVLYNGIIYVIPNDELYRKYENGEALIDKYGRLIDSKSKKVIKELIHKSDQRPIIQRDIVMVQPPEEHPIRDAAKRAVADATYDYINRKVDWVFDVGIPRLWHEHIVPFFRRTKEALTSNELKADTVIAKPKENTNVMVRQSKADTKMTQEEADIEKRKVLYHWLEMLNSLKKLHDAGEMDIDSALVYLTDPGILKRVNSYLDNNPNLLETDKYIVLHDLLGRDIYKEQQLVPIMASEITTIAKKYGYNPGSDKNGG